MGDIASRFLNVYGPNVTGEYNSDMHCPPASGTPAWEAPHMGGRLWACKHGKNDEAMTEAAHHSATNAERHRVKNFALKIGDSENDFPIRPQRAGKRPPICIGEI
jgi:hypothetical protein